MNNFAQWYVQHSKKLSIWGATQWCCVVVAIIILLITSVVTGLTFDEYVSNIVTSIITWSATLGGVTIASYMGNSAVQKYAQNKFKTQFNVTQEEEYEEDDSSNG